MTIVHRRKEGRAVTSDREREISPTVWIRCELREVIGATQDHVFDDERSPLRELDLLVEQAWMRLGDSCPDASRDLLRDISNHTGFWRYVGV